MISVDLSKAGNRNSDPCGEPLLLFQSDRHAVYHIGTAEDSAFRSNCYLLTDGSESLLIHPRGIYEFSFLYHQLNTILSKEPVTGLVISGADADNSALTEWLKNYPGCRLFTTPFIHLMLTSCGKEEYTFHDVREEDRFLFTSGRSLKFIPAPFLPSPAAFACYDETSGFLFSGDIWAAMDMDWHLVVDDFHDHEMKMNLFHIDHMASNIAARGFLNRIGDLKITAILPRHGSILPKPFVNEAMDYLRRLKCGTDLFYPDIKQF